MIRPHTSRLPTQELSNLIITLSKLHRRRDLSNRAPRLLTCSLPTGHIASNRPTLRAHCCNTRDQLPAPAHD